MHFCYLPENRNKLIALRKLEAKQRRTRLTQGALLELLKLKRELKIGVVE